MSKKEVKVMISKLDNKYLAMRKEVVGDGFPAALNLLIRDINYLENRPMAQTLDRLEKLWEKGVNIQLGNMTKEQIEFVYRFKNARLSKHLTMQELADLSQVSVNEISFIETGRRTPKRETLEKLANALNVNINYLLKGNK